MDKPTVMGETVSQQAREIVAITLEDRGAIGAAQDARSGKMDNHVAVEAVTAALSTNKDETIAKMREAMFEVLPYIEEGYVEGDPDDEPIGWQSDHDGSNQRPIQMTMGTIRRFRAALTSTKKEG